MIEIKDIDEIRALVTNVTDNDSVAHSRIQDALDKLRQKVLAQRVYVVARQDTGDRFVEEVPDLDELPDFLRKLPREHPEVQAVDLFYGTRLFLSRGTPKRLLLPLRPPIALTEPEDPKPDPEGNVWE